MEIHGWDILKILLGIAISTPLAIAGRFLFVAINGNTNAVKDLKESFQKEMSEMRTQITDTKTQLHGLMYDRFKDITDLREYVASKFLSKEEHQIWQQHTTANITRALDKAQAAHDRLDGRKDRN